MLNHNDWPLNLGRGLLDRDCSEYRRLVSEPCNEQPCPKWFPSEWSEVRRYLSHTPMSKSMYIGYILPL